MPGEGGEGFFVMGAQQRIASFCDAVFIPWAFSRVGWLERRRRHRNLTANDGLHGAKIDRWVLRGWISLRRTAVG